MKILSNCAKNKKNNNKLNIMLLLTSIVKYIYISENVICSFLDIFQPQVQAKKKKRKKKRASDSVCESFYGECEQTIPVSCCEVLCHASKSMCSYTLQEGLLYNVFIKALTNNNNNNNSNNNNNINITFINVFVILPRYIQGTG